MVAADEQQKLGEKTLKHQPVVDAKFHTEEKKAAEIKNQVQHSNIEQPLHSRRCERGNEIRRTVVA